MTAPVRSTTRVVIDRRRLLLAVVLVVLLTAAATVVCVASRSPSPGAVPVTATSHAPVVGHGRTVTMISMGGTETDALLTRVAREIGPAVARVESFWGTDWTREILVVATSSPAQFAERAGPGEAARRFDTAAVAVADRVDPVARTVTGQRVVLAPAAAAMSDTALRIVLGHELFHYAARADTAEDAPRWLTEGVADYVARPAPGRPVSIDAATASFSDADFTGDAAQLSAAYDRAWLFARFVADQYGVQTLRALYLRGAGAGHVDLPTAFRELLGAGPDVVLAQWRRWAAG